MSACDHCFVRPYCIVAIVAGDMESLLYIQFESSLRRIGAPHIQESFSTSRETTCKTASAKRSVVVMIGLEDCGSVVEIIGWAEIIGLEVWIGWGCCGHVSG